MADTREIEEYDIRRWFRTVDLVQARDTYRVVEGILETREQFQPKRAKRKDAGNKRDGIDQAGEDRRLFESTQG
jgi:hypothetical protein